MARTTSSIRRVAVLGAGVMGAGIAAHLANAGVESLLFDIVPSDAGSDPAERSRLARAALDGIVKSKPALAYRTADVSSIRPCNYDDDAHLLKEVDLIIEVVLERLDVKQKVFRWVAEHRRPGTIVSSNTSGIRLADMAEGLPAEMREHFLVTHFFNPVRYMRLLEIVAGPDTRPEVVQQVAEFGERVLGKGVVFAKDTPNFIANRIGTYGIASVFRHMGEEGLGIEEVDTIFGKPMGRPKSAVFRTADIVGLDTLAHVFANLHEYLVDDEERDVFVVPELVSTLVERGARGQKAGAGFYKKVKVDGRSEILVLDTETLEYRPRKKVRYDSVGRARKADTPGASVAALIEGDDPAARVAWRVLSDTLRYTARCLVPASEGGMSEIADDIVNVDRAMRWGFGWDLGPFETWDAIGVRRSVERMKSEGREIPAWIEQMLASGRETFYARDASGVRTYWQHAAPDTEAGPRPVPLSAGVLVLDDLRARSAEIERNPSASLFDLGEGVLGLEFHSKMNSIDELVVAAYHKALDKLDAGEFEALVVANQDPRAFCAGANILMILMGAMQQQWDAIEQQVKTLQDLLMRAKYNDKPVVTAPHGLTLGGGAEITMHSAATQTTGELYMGLVEVGVGLIPAAGGTKELLVRHLGEFPQDVDYDPNPFVQKVFERIGMARVSTSAEQARDMGFLRPQDRLTMNPDALVHDARELALGLVKAGWRPPRPRTIKVPGTTGRAALEQALFQMREAGHATEHDVTVGKRLAHVVSGGDVPWGTVRTEQDLLDLEREAFLSLCGEPKTQERMQHMLQTGKPLRN